MSIKNAALFLLIVFLVSCINIKNDNFPKLVKVALRNVGHQLLLANNDSTSTIKPIIGVTKYKYELSFTERLSIEPDSLVSIIKLNFQKAGLPEYYLTEVINCSDNEVAYSYKMEFNINNGIIPCRGRNLGESCYIIQIIFDKNNEVITSKYNIWYILFVLLVFQLILFMVYKRKPKNQVENEVKNYKLLGEFKFYPDQNKLIKEATEISLSKKECELLEIFISKPNQIIKRDELTKRVWEDNGVIVGRSLDTYISKLRKKLQTDASIKLTNVHGVGYKLEIID